MAKKNNTWGTVCDDGFEEIDAQAACHTLGFNGFIGFQVAYDSGPVLGFSKPEIPFVLYKVECSSKTANFLDCKHGISYRGKALSAHVGWLGSVWKNTRH